MALITLGFDPVEASKQADDGTYRAQVTAAVYKTARTGSPMVEVQLDIIDDPQFSGRRVYDNIVLTPQAAWKLVQFCKGIGADPRHVDPDAWIGSTCYIDVANEEWEGQMRAKVDKYRASV